MTFGDFVPGSFGPAVGNMATRRIKALGLALLAPVTLLAAPQLVLAQAQTQAPMQAKASASEVAPPTVAAMPSPTASAAASGVPAEAGTAVLAIRRRTDRGPGYPVAVAGVSWWRPAVTRR